MPGTAERQRSEQGDRKRFQKRNGEQAWRSQLKTCPSFFLLCKKQQRTGVKKKKKNGGQALNLVLCAQPGDREDE